MKTCVNQSRSCHAGVALVVLICASLTAAFVIHSVTGFLRLSRDAQELRDTLTGSADSDWVKRIEVSIGPISTALVRAGCFFVELDPEVAAAVQAVRRAEVGVYQWAEPGEKGDRAMLLTYADEAMAQRGWDRLIGFVQKRQLVAVYVPRGESSARDARACVAVLTDQELVVVSARANLEPLLQLALEGDYGPTPFALGGMKSRGELP
jgi:hypothetical protein